MSTPATLDVPADARRLRAGRSDREEVCLDGAVSLDRFLAEVERPAFRIAQMALRDRDEALDAVQDAMLHLAQSYGARPGEEWRPLFYRILYNGIRDRQRRRAVRSRLFGLLPGRHDRNEDEGDPFELIAGDSPDPARQLMNDEAMARLEVAVAALPARQQEAFALRCLQGMDVAETAMAMGCSEGSVKTHYFRALQSLRAALGEVY
jgi:RNA polymerase sigma-70 factor (ECF subfamily)